MSGLNILSIFLEENRFTNSEIAIRVCFLQEESVLASSKSESLSSLLERSLVLSDTFEAVSAGLAGAESKSSDLDRCACRSDLLRFPVLLWRPERTWCTFENTNYNKCNLKTISPM